MFKTLEKKVPNHEQYKSEHFYRYIGLVALLRDHETSDEFAHQQIVTELAESLDVPMSTNRRPINLSVSGPRLLDIDGRDLVASTREWSGAQLLRAVHEPNLDWFARIAAIEAEEQEHVVRFGYNAQVGSTMLIVSPFPEEAYADTATRHMVKQEGFRPDIKRAFIRAYHKTESGVEEHIQSIDSSELALWNIVLGEFGQSPAGHSASVLRNRMEFTGISPIDLIQSIATCYDATLLTEKGVKAKYGHSELFDTEANNFVEKYPMIISDTIREIKGLRATSEADLDKQISRIFYNSKALLDAAYAAQRNGSSLQITNASVRGWRSSEGDAAASTGKTFAGCSGNNGVDQDSGSQEVSALVSFSMGSKTGTVRNGIEAVDCINCPGCRLGVGYRDYRSKKWLSCGNGGCRNYNEQIINQYKGKNPKMRIHQESNIIIDSFRFWGINF